MYHHVLVSCSHYDMGYHAQTATRANWRRKPTSPRSHLPKLSLTHCVISHINIWHPITFHIYKYYMLIKRRGKYLKEDCELVTMRLPRSMLSEISSYCNKYKMNRTKFFINLFNEHKNQPTLSTHNIHVSEPEVHIQEVDETSSDWASRYLNG